MGGAARTAPFEAPQGDATARDRASMPVMPVSGCGIYAVSGAPNRRPAAAQASELGLPSKCTK